MKLVVNVHLKFQNLGWIAFRIKEFMRTYYAWRAGLNILMGQSAAAQNVT